MKLLERDRLFKDLLNKEIEEKINALEKMCGTDMEEAIANFRYEWIEGVVKRSVTSQVIKVTFSDKLDRIFLNKYLGIPIFVVIMTLVYLLSVGVVGGTTVEWIENGTERLQEAVASGLHNLGASGMVRQFDDGRGHNRSRRGPEFRSSTTDSLHLHFGIGNDRLHVADSVPLG